ncbi:MAG: DNRLRE domain-containing protein [Crocinitomicaceae bacterium]
MKKLILCAALLVGSISISQSVNLNPSQDNAIFSESTNSSGAGKLFSGTTNGSDFRRALLQFDIAGSIPSGAVITSVSLDLNVDNAGGGSGNDDYDLHPVSTPWGEATSVGSGGGGQGGAPVAPDATWVDAMFGTSTWTSAGGDFGASSATTTIPATTGTYTWTSAQMVVDVQNWLDNPGNNNGWILIGDEVGTGNARRFGSKEQGTAPVLTINYTCTDPPVAVCQNVNAYLDGTGNATINDADLDGGSVPVCATSLTFSASQTAFTCADISTGANPSLIISGAYDGPNTGGTPKGVELYVINDISDLSIYGLGSANNGGGTDGEEFTFPAVSVSAGTHIYVSSESTQFTAFFGFAPDYTAGAMGINGDDAIELFESGTVIDLFGDINVDGTGQAWDHLDGWAYRNTGESPNGGVFNDANWTFSGTNQLEGGSTNGACSSPFPVGTFTTPATPPGVPVTLTVTDDNSNTNTCQAVVTVLDTLPPVVDCVGSMTIVLNSTGDTTLLATDLDNATADNCGVDTLYLSKYDFDCTDDGLNQVTLYAEDLYGNIDSCTVDITISQFGVVSAVLDSVVDASCQGQTDGGVYISHSGGAGPYTYDWDNDGTGDNDDTEDLVGVGAGAYLLVIEDANGCSAQVNGVVDEPASLTFTSVTVDPTCNGSCDGSITITASSGPATYSIDNGATFQASNVFNGLCAGTYDVVVDNGSPCQATGQVTLVEPAPVVLTIANDTICSGDSDGELELIVSGGTAPYTYDLEGDNAGPIYSGLAIGSYDGMVIDANGCTSSVVTGEVVAAAAIDVTVSGLDTSVYTANEAGATYQWIRCDDSTAIAGATDQYYDLGVHGGQGEIAVVITNAFGCSDTSDCLPTEFVGLAQVNGMNVAMFPNPAQDVLNVVIEGNSELVNLNVLDMNGRLVYQTATSNSTTTINLSAFENGVYLVEMIANGSRTTQRIVVQH